MTEREATTPAPIEVESPIINSPFYEPRLHWQIEKAKAPVKANGRRPGSYYFRVPEHAGRGRKAAPQQSLLPEAELGQLDELALVNRLRQRVAAWREGTLTGRLYDGSSAVTRELLARWRSEDRMQRLFFAQIEAASIRC
jgi:type III restriction enzyme